MKTCWQFWLLPLLALGLLLSVFEVNTGEIVNTWGDAYDAYLLPSFSADSSPSVTVSPRQRTSRITAQNKPFFIRSEVAFRPALFRNQPIFRYRNQIHLRCCQWLI